MGIINSLWIKGELKEQQLLTIKSFQQHHDFVLWTYEPITADYMRDARTILPESEIYYYKYFSPSFKFGGIAERLKAELLYQIGGWHVDLDVTCLKPFDCFTDDYVLRPHRTGVVGNIIKAPAGSEFALYYLNHTKKITADNRDWEYSFKGLCEATKEYNLWRYVVKPHTFYQDHWRWADFLLPLDIIPEDNVYAIHWCSALGNTYQKGSFYHKLLLKYSIV